MLGYSGPYDNPGRPSMPGNGWIFAVVSGLLAVWLMVLTILLAILFGANGSELHHLEKKYIIVNDTTNEYVECCEQGFATPNCTCPTPGVNVSCWNAADNEPEILSGVPPATDGILYIVCEAGDTEVDGISDWDLGDYIRFVPDAGAWFQNKAMGGAGFLFQTFSVEAICPDVFTPPNFDFDVTSVMLSDGAYWLNFFDTVGPFYGSDPGDTCFIDSDALPSFLQKLPGTTNYHLINVDQEEASISQNAVAMRANDNFEIYIGYWEGTLWQGIPFSESIIVFPENDFYYTTTTT